MLQGAAPGAQPEPPAESTSVHAAPTTAPGARTWAERYSAGLAVTDAIVIVWAVIGAQLTRFGLTDSEVATISRGYDITLSYTLFSVLLILAWLLFLVIFRTRDRRMVGAGTIEYRRIWEATFWLFGVVAIIAFLLKIDLARGFILLAFPVGLLALMLSRWIWRQWLGAKRARGEYSDRVLLLGSHESVSAIAGELRRVPSAGYLVVGAVVPGAAHGLLEGTALPVTGDPDHVGRRMAELEADTLVVTSSDELPPARLRALSWALDPGRHELVMAPSLTDIGGPRIHMRPVAGLPLMHVETPRYEGAKAFAKRAFDLVGAVALIVLLSPVLIVLAVLVKATSPGPALYRAQRVGYQGRPFTMLKFRSMRDGANEQLHELLEAQGSTGTPLFKVKDDPRITRLGRVLRRWSLDELPQFLNVLGGSMSLVGPRPQVEAEVALYDDAARRRLLIKPGISGLWQISGRSDLSWEDALRLDLYYVENWSLTGDLIILWRTLKAVVTRSGAR